MSKKAIYAEDLLCSIRDDPSINGAHFARIRRHIEAAPVVKTVEVDENTYMQIMNRMFLAAESVCGNDMVGLETIGDIIREECGIDGWNEEVG